MEEFQVPEIFRTLIERGGIDAKGLEKALDEQAIMRKQGVWLTVSQLLFQQGQIGAEVFVDLENELTHASPGCSGCGRHSAEAIGKTGTISEEYSCLDCGKVLAMESGSGSTHAGNRESDLVPSDDSYIAEPILLEGPKSGDGGQGDPWNSEVFSPESEGDFPDSESVTSEWIAEKESPWNGSMTVHENPDVQEREESSCEGPTPDSIENHELRESAASSYTEEFSVYREVDSAPGNTLLAFSPEKEESPTGSTSKVPGRSDVGDADSNLLDISEFSSQTSWDRLSGQKFEPGFTFASFRIIDVIHKAGTLGEVYKAQDLDLERVVALKVIREGGVGGWERERRFNREVEVIANLDHPNIISIFNGGSHGGFKYFTMEYVKGQSLAELLKMGVLNHDKGLRIVAEVASAIDYAHRKGVIHRDLRPESILVDESGHPHITDFCLSKSEGSTSITRHPRDSSASERQASRVDEVDLEQMNEADDVLGLGRILYHVLTGKMVEISPEPPSRVSVPHEVDSKIDTEISQICIRALETDPVNRYATAGELACEIERYLEVSATRIGQRVRRGRGVVKAVQWMGFFLVLLAVFWGGRSWLGSPDTEWPESTSGQDAWGSVIQEGQILLATKEYKKAYKKFIEVEAALRDADPRVESIREDVIRSLIGIAHKILDQEDPDLDRAQHYLDRIRSRSPDHPELDRLKEKLDVHLGQVISMGRLSIDGLSPEWSVTLQKVNPVHFAVEEQKKLGNLPLRNVGVSEGNYLVVLARKNSGQNQFPIRYWRNELDAISPKERSIRIPSEILPRMTFIPGGYEGGDTDLVQSYFMDRLPVTNKDFQEYIRATSTMNQIPGSWREGTFLANHANIPVTMIPLEVAFNYALWKGKRLPTSEEFRRASIGIDRRRFPWGNQVNDSYCPIRKTDREYPRSTTLASSLSKSPYGCFDMVGNLFHFLLPVTISSRQTNVPLGGELFFQAPDGRIRPQVVKKWDYRKTHPLVGFRCARSWIGEPGKMDALVWLRRKVGPENDSGVRIEAIRQLAILDNQSAWEEVYRLVQDKDYGVQMAARWTCVWKFRKIDFFGNLEGDLKRADKVGLERAVSLLCYRGTELKAQRLLKKYYKRFAPVEKWKALSSLLQFMPPEEAHSLALEALKRSSEESLWDVALSYFFKRKDRAAIPEVKRILSLPGAHQLGAGGKQLQLKSVRAYQYLGAMDDREFLSSQLRKLKDDQKAMLYIMSALSHLREPPVPFDELHAIVNTNRYFRVWSLYGQYLSKHLTGFTRAECQKAFDWVKTALERQDVAKNPELGSLRRILSQTRQEMMERIQFLELREMESGEEGVPPKKKKVGVGD
jgi:hypothetical protein